MSAKSAEQLCLPFYLLPAALEKLIPYAYLFEIHAYDRDVTYERICDEVEKIARWRPSSGSAHKFAFLCVPEFWKTRRRSGRDASALESSADVLTSGNNLRG